MPLTIEQSGREDISITARYDGRPFETPTHYSFRVGRWEGERAWEFESIHHKLFLRNNPPEVQHFEVTHGFNHLTINRAYLVEGLIYRVGVGIILAHPESIVYGLEYPADRGLNETGYFVAGMTTQGALSKRFPVTENLFLSLEGKITASYAVVPIKSGRADLSSVALHGFLGIGYIL